MLGHHTPKKNLVIVYDESTHVFAEYLMQLISLEDDNNGEVVGCPDGSIKAVLWTEKQYLDNLATISSDQHILFIGNFKSAKITMSNIESHYHKHTIVYGWLGKKGVICLPQDGEITEKEYKYFLEDASCEDIKSKDFENFKNKFNATMDRIIPESNKNKKILTRVSSALVTDNPLVALTFGAKKICTNYFDKKEVKAQLYRFAILNFYLHGIRKFLGV